MSRIEESVKYVLREEKRSRYGKSTKCTNSTIRLVKVCAGNGDVRIKWNRREDKPFIQEVKGNVANMAVGKIFATGILGLMS